ncbi:hypothetical protein [Bradyrhizobium sp. Leo121]|uniref:hypothetical protein n=1 Tax=Bradyrhizobium sp. Leo121 TaxID=1571195 RepID=UPI0013EF2288|nr:hypothetical protein [Bradyrhizobium sp. Leo121]
MELAALDQNDFRSLRGLARKLLQSAADGENSLAAIKEVADRLDGKPAQAVEMSGGLAISHEEALDELDEPGTDDQAPTEG